MELHRNTYMVHTCICAAIIRNHPLVRLTHTHTHARYHERSRYIWNYYFALCLALTTERTKHINFSRMSIAKDFF